MPRNRTIIFTDDSLIKGEIIRLAKLEDLEEQHPELFQQIDLVKDVVEHCAYAHVFKSEYDFNLPGRSGIDYRIMTASKKELASEIRRRVMSLIGSTSPAFSYDRFTTEFGAITTLDVVVFLLASADGLQSKRTPPGYRGIGMLAATKIRKAASELRAGDQSREFLLKRLTALKEELGSGSAADIDKLIKAVETNMSYASFITKGLTGI